MNFQFHPPVLSVPVKNVWLVTLGHPSVFQQVYTCLHLSGFFIFLSKYNSFELDH